MGVLHFKNENKPKKAGDKVIKELDASQGGKVEGTKSVFWKGDMIAGFKCLKHCCKKEGETLFSLATEDRAHGSWFKLEVGTLQPMGQILPPKELDQTSGRSRAESEAVAHGGKKVCQTLV